MSNKFKELAEIIYDTSVNCLDDRRSPRRQIVQIKRILDASYGAGLKKRIEDFDGVVILEDEQGIITKDKLNELTEEWRQSRSDFEDFAFWLELKLMDDEEE